MDGWTEWFFLLLWKINVNWFFLYFTNDWHTKNEIIDSNQISKLTGIKVCVSHDSLTDWQMQMESCGKRCSDVSEQVHPLKFTNKSKSSLSAFCPIWPFLNLADALLKASEESSFLYFCLPPFKKRNLFKQVPPVFSSGFAAFERRC